LQTYSTMFPEKGKCRERISSLELSFIDPVSGSPGLSCR